MAEGGNAKSMIPKPETIRLPKYLKWIRTQPRAHCGDLYPRIEAAHQSFGNRGVGIKPPDAYALPLCAECHAGEHLYGVKTFWGNTDRKKLIIEHLVKYISAKTNTRNPIKESN